jgi:hypothetical protein
MCLLYDMTAPTVRLSCVLHVPVLGQVQQARTGVGDRGGRRERRVGRWREAQVRVRDIRVSHVTYVSLVRHVCRSCDGGNRTARGLTWSLETHTSHERHVRYMWCVLGA